MRQIPLLLAVTSLALVQALGQTQPQTPGVNRTPGAESPVVASPTYTVGPDDQIAIRAAGIDDFGSVPYRIEQNGELALPLIGRISVAGLTVAQVEQEIGRRLAEFVVNPQVTVTVVQFRTDPVFVVGAFQRPGVHPLTSRRKLLETLMSLGGLQPNASRRIKVTRRLEYGEIPLPGAEYNRTEGVSTVEISLTKLMETTNPAEDIVLQPFDVISAQKAELVYINGEVARPGPFEVNDGEYVSILQIISLAGGLTPTASAKDTRVLRQIGGTGKRGEIVIDLPAVMAGRANDFPLLPNDVLIVPRAKSTVMSNVSRTLLLTVPAVATALIVTVTR